jgi:hypothetical protein
MRRASRLLLFVLIAVVAASCRQVTPLPAEALTDLATLDQFRATFNAESHKPRLVVLLSPT